MPLTEKLLYLAVVAQVALTLIILVMLAVERVPRVARGEVDAAQVAVDRSGWHEKAKLVSNSFDSQFQLPVLFFVGALAAIYFGAVGWIEVILAWAFVVLRYWHAFVHVTTNPLYLRFFVFAAGLVALTLFWLWLGVRILLA